jgi:hypothetical protein
MNRMDNLPELPGKGTSVCKADGLLSHRQGDVTN